MITPPSQDGHAGARTPGRDDSQVGLSHGEIQQGMGWNYLTPVPLLEPGGVLTQTAR